MVAVYFRRRAVVATGSKPSESSEDISSTSPGACALLFARAQDDIMDCWVRAFAVDLKGVAEGTKVQVFEVNGPSVKAVEGEVGVTEREWVKGGLFEFAKHSVTLLRWKP